MQKGNLFLLLLILGLVFMGCENGNMKTGKDEMGACPVCGKEAPVGMYCPKCNAVASTGETVHCAKCNKDFKAGKIDGDEYVERRQVLKQTRNGLIDELHRMGIIN